MDLSALRQQEELPLLVLLDSCASPNHHWNINMLYSGIKLEVSSCTEEANQ